MPDALLTILKFCFLALMWLFFLRVLRAVWAELRAPAAPLATVGTPGAPAPAASVSSGRSRGPAPAPARMKVLEPAEARGRIYELGDELTVGRAPGCGVALPDDKAVSNLHARIFKRDGRLFLEDLGSTNGTYLNAKQVTAPTPLSRGDRVQVGRTVLEVAK